MITPANRAIELKSPFQGEGAGDPTKRKVKLRTPNKTTEKPTEPPTRSQSVNGQDVSQTGYYADQFNKIFVEDVPTQGVNEKANEIKPNLNISGVGQNLYPTVQDNTRQNIGTPINPKDPQAGEVQGSILDTPAGKMLMDNLFMTGATKESTGQIMQGLGEMTNGESSKGFQRTILGGLGLTGAPFTALDQNAQNIPDIGQFVSGVSSLPFMLMGEAGKISNEKVRNFLGIKLADKEQEQLADEIAGVLAQFVIPMGIEGGVKRFGIKPEKLIEIKTKIDAIPQEIKTPENIKTVVQGLLPEGSKFKNTVDPQGNVTREKIPTGDFTSSPVDKITESKKNIESNPLFPEPLPKVDNYAGINDLGATENVNLTKGLKSNEPSKKQLFKDQIEPELKRLAEINPDAEKFMMAVQRQYPKNYEQIGNYLQDFGYTVDKGTTALKQAHDLFKSKEQINPKEEYIKNLPEPTAEEKTRAKDFVDLKREANLNLNSVGDLKLDKFEIRKGLNDIKKEVFDTKEAKLVTDKINQAYEKGISGNNDRGDFRKPNFMSPEELKGLTDKPVSDFPTLSEYMKQVEKNVNPVDTKGKAYNDIWKKEHKKLVEARLKKGKPVSDEVLKDYPELQKPEVKETVKPTVESKKPEVETLPKDISPLEESKRTGAKRISPDRVKHQQFTPEAGIKGVMESMQSKVDAKANSWVKASDSVQKLIDEYGDSMPPRRIEANLKKYPNLESDYSTYVYLKKYAPYAKNLAEIRDYFNKQADRIKTDEKNAVTKEKAIEEYKDLIRKDISKGYKYPEEVLNYDKSFKTAVDNRARYEKGLNTSFSVDDSRIKFDYVDEIGAGTKRQDGKPITKEQQLEIKDGVVEFAGALNLDIPKLAKDQRWVYVHLSGKNPFLMKAGGLYRRAKENISISVGGTETFTKKVNGENVVEKVHTTMAHELGHALDFNVDKNLFETNFIYRRKRDYQGNYYYKHSPYWNKNVEIVARMIEQYVAIEKGNENYYTRDGYWNKEIFEKEIKPAVENALDTHYAEYRKVDTPLGEYHRNKNLVKDAISNKSLDMSGLSKLVDLTDKKVLKATFEIAKYHFENGLNKFGDWARQIIKDTGAWIKPHLKELWKYANGEKSIMGEGLSMNVPPPKDRKVNKVDPEVIPMGSKESQFEYNKNTVHGDIEKEVRKYVSDNLDYFKELRRGRITDEQLIKQATKIATGLTKDKAFDMLRTGATLSAEKHLAVVGFTSKLIKDLIKDKSATSIDKSEAFKLYAKSEAVSAELGRALRSRQLVPKLTLDEMKSLVKDVPEELKPDIQKILDEVSKDPEAVNNPKLMDKIRYYIYNAMLSRPLTHARNIIGNTSHLIYEALLTGDLPSTLRGLKRGGSKIPTTLKRILNEGGEASKFIEGKQYEPENKYLRNSMPTTWLKIEDVVFKELSKGIETEIQGKQISKELKVSPDIVIKGIENVMKGETLKNPVINDRLIKAIDEINGFAEYVTFQKELGTAGKKFQGMINAIPGGFLVVPFIRTPANILKVGLQPLKVLKFASKEYRAEFRDMTPTMKRKELTRMTAGAMTMGLLAYLTANGTIDVTGQGADDKSKKDFMEKQGWKPNSVKIGDKYISYQNTNPFNVFLGILGNYSDGLKYNYRPKDDELNIIQKMSKTTAGFVQTVTDQSFLQGLSNLAKWQETKDPYYFEQFLQMPVPGVLSAYKDLKGDNTAYEQKTFGDKLSNRLGTTDGLKPRINVFGEPEKTSGTGLPIPTQETPDALSKLLLDNNVTISYPKKDIIKSDGQKVTDDEYYNFVKESGQRIKKKLDDNFETIKGLTAGDMNDLIDNEVRKIRDDVKEEMFGKKEKQKTNKIKLK